MDRTCIRSSLSMRAKMTKFLPRLTFGFLFEKRIQQLQYLNSPEQEDHFFVMRMKIQNPRQIFFRWWLPKFLQLENLNIRKSTSYSRPFVVLSWDCFTKIHTGNKFFFSAAVRMQNLKMKKCIVAEKFFFNGGVIFKFVAF